MPEDEQRIFVRLQDAISVVNIGDEENFDQRIFVGVDALDAEVRQRSSDHFRCRVRGCHFDDLVAILGSAKASAIGANGSERASAHALEDARIDTNVVEIHISSFLVSNVNAELPAAQLLEGSERRGFVDGLIAAVCKQGIVAVASPPVDLTVVCRHSDAVFGAIIVYMECTESGLLQVTNTVG